MNGKGKYYFKDDIIIQANLKMTNLMEKEKYMIKMEKLFLMVII